MASFGTINNPPSVQTGLAVLNPLINTVLGNVYDSGGLFSVWTMVVTGTGIFTTGAAQLQGSLDNATWFNLSAALTLAVGAVSNVTTGQTWRYARVNTSTAVTGGGTVTGVQMAAADG